MSIDTQLQAVLDEIQTTVLQRHQKYGPTNVSGSPGGPLNGLRVRLHDKLARINNFVDHGGTADFTDDAFRDAFVDVVGYGLIGLLVVDGHWPSGAKPRKEHPTFKSSTGHLWVWETVGNKTGYRWEYPDHQGSLTNPAYFSIDELQAAARKLPWGPLTEVTE